MTDAARWNNPDQKRVYSTYARESVSLNGKIVSEMCEISSKHGVMLMGGILEGSSSSVYATLLTIGFDGEILGRHRKIKPTFDERLLWADGDTDGLRTYDTPEGPIGGLNCWENWIPLARSTTSGREMIHLAVWPGSHSLPKISLHSWLLKVDLGFYQHVESIVERISDISRLRTSPAR